MSNSKTFILSIVAFLIGVAVAGLYFDGEIFLMGVLFVVFVFLVLRFPNFIFVLAFVFGVGRMFFTDYLFGNGGFVGDEFRACIIDEVDVRSDKINYIVELEGGAGRLLLVASRYPVFGYGDCLKFKAKVKLLKEFEGISYAGYLRQRGVVGVAYVDDLLKYGHKFSVWEWLYSAKNAFQGVLMDFFAEPDASFMDGLLLGSRSGLPKELTNNFNATGLTHIIAISGYNISLVIVIINILFGFLGRRARVVLGSIFIVLFVLFVGASAAVVRAAIMGVISLLALYFGRKYFVSSALFFAVFLMVFWNPYILMYDKGAWLSFLATAGIVYVSPLMEPYFAFMPNKFALREATLMTVSAQVLVLPIIIFSFGRLSLISVVANIFVLPFIPWAMLFGFVAVLFSWISSFLALIFAFVAHLILTLIVVLVNFFAALPFASLEFEDVSILFVLLYYYLISKWLVPRI